MFAGLLVAIIALPLSIAFGIASGATPSQGLLTAVIGGFIVSFLGGSRVQIAGPTGAFAVIIYEVVMRYGFDGLFIATLMAGLLLILMGLFRIGTWLKFISFPVVVGFTAGIAVTIFLAQIKDAFGLQIQTLPANFIERIVAYSNNFHSVSFSSIGCAIATIGLIRFLPKIDTRIPAPFIALVIVSLAVYLFNLPVDTIKSRFSKVSLEWVPYHFSPLSFSRIIELFPSAITIALLGAIESLLCALVADGMIGGKHRSNTELIAQGIANLFTPLFGGIPITGAISRTAANIRAGGKTPIAGISHAIFLLIIIFFLEPIFTYIPMPALAGVLISIAYNMSEWREWRHFYKGPKSDFMVFIATFILTVLFDLVVAIQIGTLLSMLLFVHRMAQSSSIKRFGEDFLNEQIKNNDYEDRPTSLERFTIPTGVEVFELQGALFFGAAARFEEVFKTRDRNAKVVVLRMNQLTTIDSSGLNLLKILAKEVKKDQAYLFLADVSADCLAILLNSSFSELIPTDHYFKNLHQALKIAAMKIQEEAQLLTL